MKNKQVKGLPPAEYRLTGADIATPASEEWSTPSGGNANPVAPPSAQSPAPNPKPDKSASPRTGGGGFFSNVAKKFAGGGDKSSGGGGGGT